MLSCLLVRINAAALSSLTLRINWKGVSPTIDWKILLKWNFEKLATVVNSSSVKGFSILDSIKSNVRLIRDTYSEYKAFFSITLFPKLLPSCFCHCFQQVFTGCLNPCNGEINPAVLSSSLGSPVAGFGLVETVPLRYDAMCRNSLVDNIFGYRKSSLL